VFGRKKMEWSCFLDLELRGALPNTPLFVAWSSLFGKGSSSREEFPSSPGQQLLSPSLSLSAHQRSDWSAVLLPIPLPSTGTLCRRHPILFHPHSAALSARGTRSSTPSAAPAAVSTLRCSRLKPAAAAAAVILYPSAATSF
jgi:hypothetical protein